LRETGKGGLRPDLEGEGGSRGSRGKSPGLLGISYEKKRLTKLVEPEHANERERRNPDRYVWQEEERKKCDFSLSRRERKGDVG